MKSYTATTNIKVPRDTIWRILTDAPDYASWDPGVVRIEGRIAAGQKVTAYTKYSPDRAFSAKVTEFVPGERMTWMGGMPFGLFKGVRTFTLTPKSDGSFDFTIREEFSRPLLPVFGHSIPDMTPLFRDFVVGLKARAERG